MRTKISDYNSSMDATTQQRLKDLGISVTDSSVRFRRSGNETWLYHPSTSKEKIISSRRPIRDDWNVHDWVSSISRDASMHPSVSKEWVACPKATNTLSAAESKQGDGEATDGSKQSTMGESTAASAETKVDDGQ